MGRFRSRGEVHSHIIRLRRLFRYPRSEPIARSGRFLARSNSHSVAVRDGYTNIPLAAVGAQEDETILFNGFSSHALKRFVHPDPPELIRSGRFENLLSVCRQADFITAPSMTTPAVTYFHSATHMGRFRSRGEVQSHIIRLRRLFRYPRSEPIARSGRFLARSNSHSVAVRDGYTNIPLAAV